MDEVKHTTTERPEGAALRSIDAWWQRYCRALADTTTRLIPGSKWPMLLLAALVGLGLLALATRWSSQPAMSQSAAPQQESTATPPLVRSVPENGATNTPAVKAYLGIRGKTLHHGEVQGVKVLEVFPGSPAARAGLRADHHPSRVSGHIIVGVDGQPVRSEEDLAQILAQSFPGAQIQLFLTNATGRVSEVISVTLGAAREASPPESG